MKWNGYKTWQFPILCVFVSFSLIVTTDQQKYLIDSFRIQKLVIFRVKTLTTTALFIIFVMAYLHDQSPSVPE